jgi:CRISPR-associated protein Csd1
VEIRDIREGKGNSKRGRTFSVPGKKAHTNKVEPFLLRDTATYLLGYKEDDPNPENTRKRFSASREYHLGLRKTICTPEFDAVCNFFEHWDPDKLDVDPACLMNSGIFRMKGTDVLHYIHENPAIINWWSGQTEGEEESTNQGICLVTGNASSIATTHTPPVGGSIPGAQTKATIVSFNFRAADSFGKNSLQGLNSPVSTEVAKRYCKALNGLLASRSHRIQIGDATTIFWTERPTTVEPALAALFDGELPDDEEDTLEGEASQASSLLASLVNSLRSVRDGGKPETNIANESDVPFYILGLTGQAGGRIGVRFWHRTDVGDLIEKLAQHHRDLAIIPQWDADSKRPDPEFPPLWMLLRQTGRESKDIPPNLSGALMRSILHGAPYPDLLATSVINRIRADRDINYLRASILKAWLIRIPNTNYDIPMTYQSDKPDPAYRLGALFALLEKTQQDALGDVNAGIRDRFYSSASATPASVFPRLMRTYGHHLSKAASGNKGYQIYREREVQNVLGEPQPLGEFPSHLNLRDQGLFAIGYYHKRKDLWARKDTDTEQSK